MSKIKQTLKKLFVKYQHVAVRYPVTLVLIILTSVSTALFIDQSGDPGAFMESKGIPFLILWGIGTFFTETWLEKRNIGKWPGILAAGAAAACLIHFSTSGSGLAMEKVQHWISAYGIVLTAMGIYGNYKKSRLPFNEFCIRVIHYLSRLAIICSITAAGIALVMAVFVTLILGGEHFMLILRAEFLVLGCLVGIGFLDAQIEPDGNLPRFFIVIVKYLLMSLLLAAFVIVYIYILKIIITQVVPSNEIFRILAVLFILGLPIWTMTGTFEPDHWLVRVGTKLPYIFIPFLFLQGYAIRERILQFGMTPFRYLCIVLMVFEILYILIYALRRHETGVMLPVIAVLAVVSLVLPRFNMYTTAVRSQKAIFDRYILSDFSELPSEDQSSLAGAYYYLEGSAEGKAVIEDAAPEKIEAIKASGKIGLPEFDRNLYIYYDLPITDLDISGFGQMTLLSTFNPNGENGAVEAENVSFYDASGNILLEADISGFIRAAISSYAENQTGTPNISGRVELPDGSCIQVYHCSMTVEPENRIRFLDLNAVWLKQHK